MEYKHLLDTKDKELWNKSFENELGRLSKGVHPRIAEGTDTIQFIKHTEVPINKRITYGRIVVAIKHNKEDKENIIIITRKSYNRQ